jgi:predicted acyl esterase
MVLIGGLALLAGGCSPVPHLLARAVHARPAQFGVKVERGVSFLTSDSVALVSDVYHPKGAGKTPTILVRLPYTKAKAQVRAARLVAGLWAARGYTVVMQGTRGRYESGGIYYPMRDERRDGIETLRWLSTMPWYQGRMGMWGGSYFGYTQWVLADQTDPGLDALMIQNASTDFHGMFHPGGAFSLESALYWALRSFGSTDAPPPIEALERGYHGFPLIEADDRAGTRIPFFDDWASHSERNGYWSEIDGERRAATLEAPVFLGGGWFDAFLPGVLADYSEIQAAARPDVAGATRLVIGPWAHTYTVKPPHGKKARDFRIEALAPSLDWFDRHLGGAEVGREETSRDPSAPSPPTSSRTPAGARGAEPPPVRIYVMGENQWRDEREWPPARARPTAYYLNGGGRANTAAGDGELTTDAPVGPARTDSFVYDPLDPVPTAGGAMLGPRAGIFPQNVIESRADVLVYSTSVLERDLEVTGYPSAVLHVSTTASSTDFTVKLVDVHPDGTAYNVCDGILRRRYDAAAADSLGDVAEIRIELWPTSMVFRQGHRVRLEVSSSNFPRYDRNPNTGGVIATETRVVKARQSIHHGPAHLSRLVLPVIPR